MKFVTLVCDVCREVISDDEHCTPHNMHPFDNCDCGIHYHMECCPDCIAEREAAENAAWIEFLNNERLHEAAERLGL